MRSRLSRHNRRVALVILIGLVGIALVVGGTAGHASAASSDTIAGDTENTSRDTDATETESFLVYATAPPMTSQAETAVTTTTLKDRVNPTQKKVAKEINAISGVSVHERFWIANVIRVEINTDRVDPDEIAAIGGVDRVIPDTKVTLAEATTVPEESDATSPSVARSVTSISAPTSNTASVGTQSGAVTDGLAYHKVPAAWATGNTRGAGATIAVLDTGVNESHPDIDLAADGWVEFTINGTPVDSEPYDPDGHGTHVSGTAAGGNASGTAIGVAPDATLYHAKVFPGNQSTTSASAIIAGIQWAVEHDADVATLSVGGREPVPAFIEPIRNARAAGTLVVSASGNGGPGTSVSPANVYDGIAVGAIRTDGETWAYSSGDLIVTDEVWGEGAPTDWPDEYVVPDVTAVGVGVNSASTTGGYERKLGTSMATPHVGGTVALLRAAHPDLSVETVERALRMSAVHPRGDVTDTRYGHGWIDANATLTAVTTGTITGRVTDVNGGPVTNATVTADGQTTTTSENGIYTLSTDTGEYNITISAFGFQTTTQRVTVDPMSTTSSNLTLTDTVDARKLTDQPAEIDTGTAFDVEFEVANTDSITIDTPTESAVRDQHISITVGNQTISPGGTVLLDSVQSGPLTVTVETAPPATGNLTLTHSFAGADTESVLVTTGPTTLITQGPAFEIEAANVPTQVERNENRTVEITVKNRGNELGTDTVQYQIGNKTINETEVSLAEGDSTTVNWNISYTSQPGEYTQRVVTSADIWDSTLTVEGDLVADDYRNEAGEMRIQGLRVAIDDFVAGEIEIGVLRNVIDAFAAQ